MNNCCPFLHVLRKIIFFALIGIAVVFLTGPVLAVMSFVVSAGLVVFFFLLPFVVLGSLIWLPIRILGGGAGARRRLAQTTRVMGHAAFVVPARTCGHLKAGARGLTERLHTATAVIGAVFVEATSAALVGAMLGTIAAWRTDAMAFSIPIGAVLGLGLGVIVGASRLRQPVEAISAHATPNLANSQIGD